MAKFHSQKRKNETHESTTDPDARLNKKSYGKEAQLAYHRSCAGGEPQRLIAAAMTTQADAYGRARSRAAAA